MVVPGAGPGGLGVSVYGVVFTDDGAFLDNGSLHGRSFLEVDMVWVAGKDELGQASRVPIVWLAREGMPERPQAFIGMVAVEMFIDPQARRGWKDFSWHVNRMTDAVRGQVDIGLLSAAERRSLKALLEGLDEEWLSRSEAIRKALEE
jgi:hypothetical protein